MGLKLIRQRPAECFITSLAMVTGRDVEKYRSCLRKEYKTNNISDLSEVEAEEFRMLFSDDIYTLYARKHNYRASHEFRDEFPRVASLCPLPKEGQGILVGIGCWCHAMAYDGQKIYNPSVAGYGVHLWGFMTTRFSNYYLIPKERFTRKAWEV